MLNNVEMEKKKKILYNHANELDSNVAQIVFKIVLKIMLPTTVLIKNVNYLKRKLFSLIN